MYSCHSNLASTWVLEDTNIQAIVDSLKKSSQHFSGACPHVYSSYICVNTCMCACNAEVWWQPWVSFFRHHLPFSLCPGLAWQATLTEQQAQGISLSLPLGISSHWDYKLICHPFQPWFIHVEIKDLVVSNQAFYWLIYQAQAHFHTQLVFWEHL